MSQRYFTLEEAEAFIPRLQQTMTTVRDLKRQVDAKVSHWQQEEPTGPVDQALAKGQLDFLVVEINRLLESVSEQGCLPKDLEIGLVDFPARMDGQEVYLCWKLDEKHIRFWHGITEGFGGRKPLEISLSNP